MAFGIFLVLLGLSILLKVLFKIDLPVFRTLFALFFIYIGVRMLAGTFGFRSSEKETAVFSEAHFEKKDDTSTDRYSVIFGKGTIDLTQVSLEKGDVDVEVNVVFGEGIVRIDPKMPISLRSTAVFGEARMPDDNIVAFGELNYNSAASKDAQRRLRVRGNVVFGSLRFIPAPPR